VRATATGVGLSGRSGGKSLRRRMKDTRKWNCIVCRESYCTRRAIPAELKSATSGLLMLRGGSQRRPSSYAPPSVSRTSGSSKSNAPKPATFSRRFTAGSPKVSTHHTSRRRRRCWRSSQRARGPQVPGGNRSDPICRTPTPLRTTTLIWVSSGKPVIKSRKI
jgi:hypothetical protein